MNSVITTSGSGSAVKSIEIKHPQLDNPMELKFELIGYMKQEEKGFDFEFHTDNPEKAKAQGHFLYMWSAELSILYVGMTKQSIKKRMDQHTRGMRGEEYNEQGPSKSLVASDKPRSSGFGSTSGGAKRKYLELFDIKCLEVWAYEVELKEKGKLDETHFLKELEGLLRWELLKKVSPKPPFHLLRLNKAE